MIPITVLAASFQILFFVRRAPFDNRCSRGYHWKLCYVLLICGIIKHLLKSFSVYLPFKCSISCLFQFFTLLIPQNSSLPKPFKHFGLRCCAFEKFGVLKAFGCFWITHIWSFFNLSSFVAFCLLLVFWLGRMFMCWKKSLFRRPYRPPFCDYHKSLRFSTNNKHIFVLLSRIMSDHIQVAADELATAITHSHTW